MEDAKIIELFFERSEQAIAEFSYKYGGVCRKIAYNILNNFQDAEECVNDTYLGAWNSIPPQNPNPLVTYICKITRNIALKKYRYNTAKRRNGFYDISLSELEESIPSVPRGVSSCTEEELTKTIEKYLDTLDRKSRVMGKKRIGTMAAVVLSMMLAFSITAFASESENPENTIMAEISEYISEQYGYLSSAEQNELAEEIYQEKYVEAAMLSMNVTDETDENVADIAYQNMIARETYIAELISLHEGVETTMSDW